MEFQPITRRMLRRGTVCYVAAAPLRMSCRARILLTVLVFLFHTSIYAQVLRESSRQISHGFREVHRSEVNPPGHWEGVGHFVFVYFKTKQLCQCSSNEFFISPTGQYAIYINDKTGVVILFNSGSEQTKTLTTKFIALLARVDWQESLRKAVVFFQTGKSGERELAPLQVSL